MASAHYLYSYLIQKMGKQHNENLVKFMFMVFSLIYKIKVYLPQNGVFRPLRFKHSSILLGILLTSLLISSWSMLSQIS